MVKLKKDFFVSCWEAAADWKSRQIKFSSSVTGSLIWLSKSNQKLNVFAHFTSLLKDIETGADLGFSRRGGGIFKNFQKFC